MYSHEERKSFSLNSSQVYLNLNRVDGWVDGTKFQTYGLKENEKIGKARILKYLSICFCTRFEGGRCIILHGYFECCDLLSLLSEAL